MNKPGQGTMRVNASHHAACRTSHPGRDAGVSRRQQQSQLRRRRPQADLWPSRGRLARPKVPGAVEKGQRNRAPLSRQDQRTPQSANHPFDRPLARARRHRAASLAAPPLPTPLYARRYPAAAETDAAHEGLSAPAVRRILQREFKVHRQAEYERLASISASHIYNLRRTGPIANTMSITPRRAPRR